MLKNLSERELINTEQEQAGTYKYKARVFARSNHQRAHWPDGAVGGWGLLTQRLMNKYPTTGLLLALPIIIWEMNTNI